MALDPEATGEVHGVLSFAPEPDSLARALFDDATVQAHLDHLAQGQKEDGGWTFNWPPGHRPPNWTGAASSPSTPSAPCAPTAVGNGSGPAECGRKHVDVTMVVAILVNSTALLSLSM